ncbi:endonuclease III [Candidatus Bathyarchaeota archaeon]|nr:endonuclease III [Candidatus Bathyarchaeota archaeon]
MDEETRRAEQVLETLKAHFGVPQLVGVENDPFNLLVRTIISQSTAEANTQRAYQNLSRKFSIEPKVLANAEIAEIEEALKVAGLHRNKARVLKRVAAQVLEKFNGSLSFIHDLTMENARRELMRLPGVGPKTADVLLLFSAQKPTLPVDTHVNRVSKRLNLVPMDAGYDVVRERLQKLYPPDEYLSVHLLFISLGRKYCRALRPAHAVCPVRKFCPSAET